MTKTDEDRLGVGMSVRKCDLNLFQVFDTIYTERNLTQAAKSLSITQPAVSNALARLRKLFNDDLFVRTARGMMPTPVAESIAQNVSEALSLLSASILDRDGFDASVSERTYQFSMTDLAEAVVLPRLIPYLKDAGPKISLQSYYVKRHELLRQLARGEVDFAVDVPLVEDPQLCHQSLIRDDYVCVVRHDHQVLQDELTLERYLALRHIQLSSRKKGLGPIDLALLQHDAERMVRLRVQHYRVAVDIVASTDLVLSLPRFLADRSELVVLPLPFEVPPLDYHLYWHRHSDKDVSHCWMREALLGLFKEEQFQD